MLSKKLPNIFLIAVLFIVGFLFLTLFIKNTIIFAFSSIALFYFVIKKFKLKKFAIWLFIVSLIVRIGVVLVLKTPIESDFQVIYDASLKLLHGDLSFNSTRYFQLWGYQTGQVVYQAALLKVVNSAMFLKIMNCIISSGTVVLTYLISRELFKERTAKLVGALYSIFIFPILFNAVLSNQILSTFLTYLAIYLLFSKKYDLWKPWLRYSVVGVLLSFANIMRPEGIVFLTTILIFFLYYLTKGNWKENLKKVILIFLSYFVIFTLVSNILIATNISQNGLSNMDPLWKFVLGFNHKTVGSYSTEDEYMVGNKEIELGAIKERVFDDIEKIPILFIKKARNFWLTSDLYWSNHYLENKTITFLGKEINGSDVNQYLNNYNKCIYFLMYFFLILGLYHNRKNVQTEITNFLLIFLCVYIGVYLLIEIMPRYAYCPQVALFILSGFGIEYILKKLEVNHNEK